MDSLKKIGFVGLGKMGTPMAINIQKTGYPMVVYDAREEAAISMLEGGAKLADSPAATADLSDIVITCLPRPQVVEEVVTGSDGILKGIKQGSIYIDMSTCGPGLIRRLEPLFNAKGAHVLDAPVLSSPLDAPGKSVIVMVGGEKHIFDSLIPMFEAFADKVVYTGGLGTANICKVVHNMTTVAMQQVVAEGLTLGVKAGVDLEILLESGSRGPIGASEERLSPTVFKNIYDPPVFTLDLARKDIGLATKLGRESGVPLPVANLVEQIMMQAMNRRLGDSDRTIAVTLQEEWAGAELRRKFE